MWLSKAGIQALGSSSTRCSILSLVGRQKIKPLIRTIHIPSTTVRLRVHKSSLCPDNEAWDSQKLWPFRLLPIQSLEYEGNLVDGIVFAKDHLSPPTWSLDDEVGREKISRYWSAWAPPTEADVHRFFDEFYGQIIPFSQRSLFTPPCRQILIPYFTEMHKTWGFELSTFHRRYWALQHIIVPEDDTSQIVPLAFEDEDATFAIPETKIHRLPLGFIRAVQCLTAITGHKHEPLELLRANECTQSQRDYLTFTARNMSTGVSNTFQAIVQRACNSHPDEPGYLCKAYYMRMKPSI
ncbi:hypothetical protein Tsubulata_031837 [Turnera subulata]|uniref:Uncharacterized protein n=1 Tax=Turnera subulata TaxID=218843 RepID=A0A9Q0FVL0_9ROSI|nr:hypothetical protein Tsubulata_031837 [Turnera subulata]